MNVEMRFKAFTCIKTTLLLYDRIYCLFFHFLSYTTLPNSQSGEEAAWQLRRSRLINQTSVCILTVTIAGEVLMLMSLTFLTEGVSSMWAKLLIYFKHYRCAVVSQWPVDEGWIGVILDDAQQVASGNFASLLWWYVSLLSFLKSGVILRWAPGFGLL